MRARWPPQGSWRLFSQVVMVQTFDAQGLGRLHLGKAEISPPLQEVLTHRPGLSLRYGRG